MTSNKIILAAQLADDAHKGQFRKWGRSDTPYIIHPMRVMGMVMLHPHATEEMVIAAVLHDTLEDTTLTEDELFAKGFGGEVAYFVVQLTNASKSMPKSTPREERKAADRAKIAKAPWEARLIKLADRFDNLMEMRNDPQTPADFAVLYKHESRLLLEVLKGVDDELEARLAKMVY